jgi:hypothetical protein
MRKLNYEEGDVFAVPLRTGGFALGLVARMPKSGKVLFGYFWGPARTALPEPKDLPELHPRDALFGKMFSDLGLIKKEWPILTSLPGWKRAHWPMPKFLRQSPLSKRAWLVTYADDDPNQVSSEDPCAFDVTGYEKDGLLGSGATEILLTHLLSPA